MRLKVHVAKTGWELKGKVRANPRIQEEMVRCVGARARGYSIGWKQRNDHLMDCQIPSRYGSPGAASRAILYQGATAQRLRNATNLFTADTFHPQYRKQPRT